MENLLAAYRLGIFPWPEKDAPIYWFSPDPRGILRFDQFKIPRSTTRIMQKKNFRVTTNQAFNDVIQICSEVPRPGQSGTWITPDMLKAYNDLHQRGIAKSWEVWLNGDLVGGLYGIEVQGVFSGESMFHKVSEASKVCLVHVVDDLRAAGHKWMDIQMVTPVLAQMGGESVPRSQFLDMLEARQRQIIQE